MDPSALLAQMPMHTGMADHRGDDGGWSREWSMLIRVLPQNRFPDLLPFAEGDNLEIQVTGQGYSSLLRLGSLRSMLGVTHLATTAIR
jgi:hypothetical protein